MAIKNKSYYTQFPSWIITYKNLTHFQFRLYTLLEHYRFLNIHPTSDELAEHLDFNNKNPKAFRDYLRHELNKFKNIFPEDFLTIHFKSCGIGKSQKILIKFNYWNNELKISDENESNISIIDKHTLIHFLKNSHYFSNNQLDEILTIKKVNFENLIKGLLYVDTRKDVIEPLRYLRSCFKQGVFKYDKEKFDLELLDTKAKDYQKRVRKLSRIDSNLVYAITLKDAELLKHVKDEHLNFYGAKTETQFLITRATYKTKNANVKNSLDKLKIPYQPYLR